MIGEITNLLCACIWVISFENCPIVSNLLVNIIIGSRSFYTLNILRCIKIKVLKLSVITIFLRDPMMSIIVCREPRFTLLSSFGIISSSIIVFSRCSYSSLWGNSKSLGHRHTPLLWLFIWLSAQGLKYG